MKTKNALIRDATAIIQGYEHPDSMIRIYTVPQVVNEIRDTIPKLRLEAWINAGKITVMEPDTQHVEDIESETRKMGESRNLSTPDKMVLALALQLKTDEGEPMIVSDDYSVQNMASKLGIKYISIAVKGIKRRIEWEIYCPGCRRRYDRPQSEGICPVCGTALKRRPAKKAKL